MHLGLLLRRRYFPFAILFILTFVIGQGCGNFESKSSLSSSSSSGYVDDGLGNLVRYVAPKRQIRVLSPVELRNTVEDLTTIQISSSINYGDFATGYDTGVGLQMDEGVFNTISVEIEKVSQNYVDGRLKQQYPCFAVANFNDDCFYQWLDRFAPMAFRGSISELDITQLRELYSKSAAQVGKPQALKLLVFRILLSPKLLYRTEIGTETNDGRIVLTDLEKANLVSYAVTGSMPDQALLSDGIQNKLSEDNLKSHIGRLILTTRGRKRVSEFFQAWLKLDSLNLMQSQPAAFPKFAQPQVAQSLLPEFQRYVESVVVDGNSTLDALFLSSHGFVNRHTASLYNLASTSESFERVNMPSNQRRGILTLASVMAVHASKGEAFKDSPTERGLLVKERLLCESAGLPSGINTDAVTQSVLEEFPNFSTLTVRDQLNLLMEQGNSCKACHAQFMPFGFLFSNYNAEGRFVSEQKGHSVRSDVSNLDGGDTLQSDYGSVLELLPDLTKDPRLGYCLTRNLVRYTIGYQTGDDHNSLAQIMSSRLILNSKRINKLFEELYSSPLLFERLKGESL